MNALDLDRAHLAANGYALDQCILAAPERFPPPYFLLFEKVMNAVHEHAPHRRGRPARARIAE